MKGKNFMENDELIKKDNEEYIADIYERERRRRLDMQRDFENCEKEKRRKMCRSSAFFLSVISLLILYKTYEKEDYLWHQGALWGTLKYSIILIAVLVAAAVTIKFAWNNKEVFLVYMFIRMSIASLVILWLVVILFPAGIILALPIFFIWVFPFIRYLSNYRE